MIKLFLLTTMVALIAGIKIEYEIKQYKTRCVGEYIIENTLALFIVKSSSDQLNVKLLDSDGNTVYSKKGQLETKIAFTAKVSGNHQLCIDNEGPLVKAQFSFKTGVAAKDYSSIAKQSNLKPMELNVRLNSI